MMRMSFRGLLTALVGVSLTALVCLSFGESDNQSSERLMRLRTLGKAFYENPTTQTQAVEQFRQAWQMNPNSTIDHLNYGLALLRAGMGKDGCGRNREGAEGRSVPPSHLVQPRHRVQEAGRNREGHCAV